MIPRLMDRGMQTIQSAPPTLETLEVSLDCRTRDSVDLAKAIAKSSPQSLCETLETKLHSVRQVTIRLITSLSHPREIVLNWNHIRAYNGDWDEGRLANRGPITLAYECEDIHADAGRYEALSDEE